MYEIGCAIIYIAGLLEKLGWLITDLLSEPVREVLPRYYARCFFRAWNNLRILGEFEWNCQVLGILMDDYGHVLKSR